MPPLRGYFGDGDRNERAARFIEAVLRESSLHVMIRDQTGLVIESNPRPLQEADISPEAAETYAEHARYFDGEGRELARLDVPGNATRVTGAPHRGEILGLRLPDGTEFWVKGDTLPLESGEEGWTALEIAVDVTDLYVAQRDANERVRMLEALVELARCTRQIAPEPGAVATAIKEPLDRILPDASLVLAVRSGSDLELWTILTRHDASEVSRRFPLSGEVAKRWSQDVHVNQHVRNTDIYGDFAVGSLAHPYRSIVTVRVADRSGRRIASLAATHPLPDAFSASQVEFMEEAAGLIGPVLGASADDAEA